MAPDPIARLRTTAKTLPADIRADVLALGPTAVTDLIALLDDDDASMEDAPGDGWPPIHAVELLSALKADEAIDPMLRALVRTDWMSILHDRILMRLPDFGAAVTEPALVLLAEADDREVRHSLCAVLSKIGARDDRVYEALCREFDDDPSFASSFFYDYGDPAALPLLLRAIEEFKPDFSSLFRATNLANLVEAFEKLGGTMPADLQDRVDGWRARWDALRQSTFEPVRRSTAKVGRNDPCPCGSGKKYKKCHLDAELPT
jgi:hypothetical protein